MKPKLTIADFERAAKSLGVSMAHVRAVAEVESRGAGFLKSGDPSLLFERHLFSRWTNGVYDKTHPDISGPRGGYGAAGQNQHVRMKRAEALNRDVAWRSASWGMFQVFGDNWRQVGYPSLEAFVEAQRRSEGDHLDAFVGYVKGFGLVNALKTQNWHAFARGYNGRDYASHGYHTKLAAAFKKWSSQ